jgi:hypothetical protein
MHMRELPNWCYSDLTPDERMDVYIAVRDAMFAHCNERFGHRVSFSNAKVDIYAGLEAELLHPEIQRDRRRGKGFFK